MTCYVSRETQRGRQDTGARKEELNLERRWEGAEDKREAGSEQGAEEKSCWMDGGSEGGMRWVQRSSWCCYGPALSVH